MAALLPVLHQVLMLSLGQLVSRSSELGVIENSIAKSTHWRPNFAEIGLNIMQPEAFRRYLAREAMILVYKIFQASPPSVRLSINPDMFFKAITFINESGEQETMKEWDLAPGGERDGEREEFLRQVTNYSNEATSFIPLKAVKLQESDERAKRKRTHDGSPAAKRRRCSKTTTKRVLCTTPTLLLHLTPGTFCATRKNFEFAYMSSGSPALLAVHANETFPLDDVNGVARLTRSDSGGIPTFKRVSELMRTCGRTLEATHELQVLVRLNRAQLMHAMWLVGNWLYIGCAAYVKDYVDGTVMVNGDFAWLQPLTSAIWRHFFVMSKDQTLIQPSEYGFHDPALVPFVIERARYSVDNSVVVSCVLDCLASFLVPDLPDFRNQSALVDELLKLAKSPGILLLDPVYTAFEDVWASFSDPKKTEDMNKHLDGLVDGFPSLLTRDVKEDLVVITQIAEKFVPGFASYGSSAFGDRRSAASQDLTSNSQAGPSSVPYNGDIAVRSNSSGERHSTPSISQAASSSIRATLPSLDLANRSTTDTVIYMAAERVVLFLRSAYNVYSSNAEEIQDPVTIFLMDKKNPRDSFLPFREKAPSRTTILEEPSPYQPENVRRCVGFFGAVIFRAVTFKCNILLEKNHRLFGSLDEWLSLVDDYLDEGMGDDFFCDRCAYGPTDKRGRRFVPEFWPPATEWEKYLLEHPNLSFIELFEYIDRLNMPSVGALTSYLIATDFAYADLVPFPSPTEVATAIIKLGAGARHGLEKLKVWTTKKKGTKKKRIKKKKGDDDNEIARFVLLHDKVKALLSPEEQVNMGYDTLMLEHTLCKLSKMTKLKEIKNRVLNDL
ncbi:hypothetical protein BD410DRAFT_846839 [Rickenella mellea]|uniref:Uncharacterized protein n=1 Tax=Rickenella mellea TaxID=50990 RepID=A0A4Y7PGB0_9AGAM|nr:hypothetical protein BD410DRAFT_846839 [Rickenella mellea]